jgi:ribosomal protein S2
MTTGHLDNRKAESFPSSHNKCNASKALPRLLFPKIKTNPPCVNQVEGRVTLQQAGNPFASFCTAVYAPIGKSHTGHHISDIGKLRKRAQTVTTSSSSRKGDNVYRNQRPTGERVPFALPSICPQSSSSHAAINQLICMSTGPSTSLRSVNNIASNVTRLVTRAKKTISLIKGAGHVGHNAASTLQPRLRHPQSLQLLLGKRGRGDVACLSTSVDQAARGLYLVARVLQHGGHVLLIDTRGETSALQRFIEARSSLLPLSFSFGGQHWVGGTLTNWSSISKTVSRCAQISNQFDAFLMNNRVHLPRYEKMRRSYLGFLHHSQSLTNLGLVNNILNNVNRLVCKPYEKIGKDKTGKDTIHRNSRDISVKSKKMVRDSHTNNVKLTGYPDLLIVINPAENKQIIKESERLGIPVVGVVDSNDNLHGITVPVSINPGSLLQPDSFGIRAVQLAIGRECVI